MITYSNWLTSNVKEIDSDKKYKLYINLFQFSKEKFHNSADWCAKNIGKTYSNIYVGLSGGMDSEYVVRCLHRNNIEFTPIIVTCPGSEIETNRAFDVCRELNITPKQIAATLQDIIASYNKICQNKVIGDFSVLRIIAASYVNSVNGVFIQGNSILGDDGENYNTKIKYGSFGTIERDEIIDVIYPSSKYISFFLYHPKLVYSIIENVDEEKTWNEYKQFLYGISIREKRRITYPSSIIKLMSIMKNKYQLSEIQYYSFGNYKEFMKLFDKYVIDQ